MKSSKVAAHAETILRESRMLEGPYFKALKARMSLPAFRATQEQFYYAVLFFPRPMAALIGRIPQPAARLDILHNLLEEHGDFRERAFHENTFKRFLGTIGGRAPNLKRVPLWPEMRAFNTTLISSCLLDEVEVGVACMGMIERAFADVSAAIGAAVVARGWVPADKLVHYKLHARIDSRHAEEFFGVVEGAWKTPSRRYYIDQGLRLGVYVFDRLYRDMALRVLSD
ncbi:MAG: iron-containing redox enzyme family protein [Elusimicrobia bacterium]|nr:iron-containing redox enzyme family protein [Elusimicrobiota bacterium]